MKISINFKEINGPYGGVASFYNSFKDFLNNNGHTVVNDLNHDDIDVIILTTYFKWLSASFSFIDAKIYKIKHPQCLIINRINNSDQGRNSNYLNNLLIKTSTFSDHSIFISEWLRDIFKKEIVENFSVIHNGGDTRIFNQVNKKTWDPKNKLKIVTHHWSSNQNKGHDLYLLLDRLLENKRFGDLFEFTYIGNANEKNLFKNTTFIPAKSGLELAKELKKKDLYITAAKNEAAGMHHIEGALCGLPLLYVKSGALPEYCGDYGIMINEENLEESLNNMRANYTKYLKKLSGYRFTDDAMNKDYLKKILALKNEHRPVKKDGLLKKYIKLSFLELYSFYFDYIVRIAFILKIKK